jgi:hypothetical protein
MAQRLRSRATAAIAAGMAATCIGVAAAPAFADTVRNQEWWLTSLHVTKAWLSSRGAGVTVAVLDTGVDTNQPDLAGSVITGRDYTGSGRAAGGPFWGTHGTAVASLIAGHGHSPHHGDGVVGVAPLAKILSVRVTLENKDPLLANPTVVAALPAAIAHGIDYAVRHGAQVIELPLDPAAQAGGTTTGGSPAERAAVKAALRKGVVLVAPSGDNGAGTDTINYPAAYPGVISVGAFGQGFVKAPFTNHQSYATLTAAGDGDIAANGPTAYAKLKSTSAASAVVAGIAALIRSQFPTFTPAQVEQALTSGTVFRPKGGQKTGSGVGTADAAAALVAAAKINATPTSSGSPGSAANPTPPAAPKVTVHTKSLWQAVRIPVLGLAALVLLALIILITVRVRQRRALDAQLAPLQAAARASRAQSAAGMTGMGSPGPGYGGPPAAMTGRGPASSEPVGSGPANFGLGGPEPGSVRLGSSRLAPAGSGFASDDAPDRPWAGASEARTGRPMPASVGRPAVSGKPPWEEDDALAPAPMPAPPAPEPSRSGGRFLLPGRGLGGSLDAAGGPGPGGGPAGRGSASADPADRSSTTGSFPVGSSAAGNSAAGNSAAGNSAAGAESRNSLNLGGWSLGKPASEGGAGGRTGAPGAGNGAGNDAAEGGNRTAGRGIPGGSAAGQPAGFTGPGSTGPGSTGAGTAGTDSPGAAGGTGNFPGTNATGSGATGTGNQNMTTSAGPGGPLAGLGGAGPNAAATAARARFGPSPFDDPSFEIPAFSPSASDGPAFDDSAFGAPGPGTPLDEPTLGGPALGGPALGGPALGGPALGGPALGGPAQGGPSLGRSALGRPAPGVTPPGVPADAGRPGTTAGTGGTRGSGRHGAARGSSGGNPPVSGGADADSSSLGRTGDAPAQPMRTLGSAHRLNAVRGPRAAGHPPWEPAEKPASELPWMDAPASGPNRMAPPRRVFPAGAEGQAAGSAGGLGAGQTAAGQAAAGQTAAGETDTGETGSGRPASADPADPGPSMTASGLVRRPPKSQSPFPDLAGPPAGRAGPPASGPAEEAEEPRPMYSWNPSDPTEAFPAVPPPGDSRPG